MECKTCKTHIKEGRSFCSIGCYNKSIVWDKDKREAHSKVMSKAMIASHERTYGPDFTRIRTCPKCNSDFEVVTGRSGKGGRRYCSVLCSNSKKMSDSTKAKIANTISTNHPRYSELKTCLFCKKEFISTRKHTRNCSRSCAMKEVGNRPEQIKNRRERMNLNRPVHILNKRSKNEILFFELCSIYFKSVRSNAPIFNGWDADVIIDDHLLAVMWNGKWHYEKLRSKHSVSQVQNRDRLKQIQIKECGYIPYVIKDLGSHNPLFVKNQFKILLEYLENIK
jgi:hypothetical protein